MGEMVVNLPAPPHPFDLFGSGHDTAEIARIAGISEAEAYNRMADERKARRNRRMADLRKDQIREAKRRREARNRAELARLREAARMPPMEARR